MYSAKNKAFIDKEKQFDEFFEIAPEGITILDVQTRTFIKCNSNAVKLLKLPADEILRKGPVCISPKFQPDGRRSDEKASELIALALGGASPVFEWLTINGEGNTFMTEVRLVALSGRRRPTLYASFIDITERKKTEKRLQDQNRSLSEIAFLQSHQVRQPVAVILGIINLFDFDNPGNPLNAELLLRLKTVTTNFDEVIKEVVLKTLRIKEDHNIGEA